jgi:hypothetical protein
MIHTLQQKSMLKALFGSIEFFIKIGLKNYVGMFEYQFLKVENQFLETQMTYFYPSFNLFIGKGRGDGMGCK